METTNASNMTGRPDEPKPVEQLSELFGSYKAEWLRERMFDLFTEPAYFPELATARPCMLLGGRGTGKTTVLRCLSHEGQFAISGHDVSRIAAAPFYGLYYRVNTNRVTAFRGPELTEDRWIRTFAHYLNLVLCDLVLNFLEWYQLHNPNVSEMTASDCEMIALSLNIGAASSVQELSVAIGRAKVEFEAFINNVSDKQPLQLSMQEAPVDALFRALLRLPHFSNKSFFFLIDEYENFLDYQQQVVNTLIKHCGALYTFKVGVKELGWRARSTLNANEQLISPADYVRINIVEELEGDRFRKFSLSVANDRIQRLRVSNDEPIRDMVKAFPGLTEEEEAEILDQEGYGYAAKAKDAIVNFASAEESAQAIALPILQAYFLETWAKSQNLKFTSVWKEFAQQPEEWTERYQNYKHALLYTLRKGKRGIQKHYAGWSTFTQLAAGNIRYLLELVDQSLLLHLQRGGKLSRPVPVKVQTLAAQNVGKKNISELEGLSVHGAQLTKLLLGLGRVFQLMAADVAGHAPEVNQFHIAEGDTDSSKHSQDGEAILKAAVMHLALLRSPGNKAADEADTKDYDYMVHPIFSAFFVFSYRKKRKLALSYSQLLGLVTSPKRAIPEILLANNRTSEDPLPEQLLLFEGYYDANS
jgi:hypothetical protein